MKKYFLFGAYLLLSLVIGEFHPLSRFPMYNSFPNYAYVFYLNDEKAQLVPYLKYFDFSKNASYVAFDFYSFFNYNNYPLGYGNENPIHLKKAGESLTNMILEQKGALPYDFDTLKIYRRNYFIKDNHIQYNDHMMYEKALHP